MEVSSQVNDRDSIRVLLVAPWDDAVGGVVTVVNNIAKELKSRGHEVLYFHPDTPVRLRWRTTKNGFPGVRLRLGFPFSPPRRWLSAVMFPFLFPMALLQLLWFVHQQRIHVINVHFPNDRFFYFAICKRLLRVVLVTSVHGSDVFQFGHLRQKYSASFKFLISGSDLIVLPSENYRRKFVIGFPEVSDRTILIHNGVDASFFVPQQTTANADRSGRYILCIAALARWKGIDVLLRAATALLLADSSLRLVIVGDGPLRSELQRLARDLCAGSQIEFVGTKQASEVMDLLHRCEVFVLPSRAESFGLVAIEALACKKPVIATAVGGIPEIIENEKTGILVPPDDPTALSEAIQRVLADDELKTRIAENGYAQVLRQFCSTHLASAYEHQFISLCHSSPTQAIKSSC